MVRLLKKIRKNRSSFLKPPLGLDIPELVRRHRDSWSFFFFFFFFFWTVGRASPQSIRIGGADKAVERPNSVCQPWAFFASRPAKKHKFPHVVMTARQGESCWFPVRREKSAQSATETGSMFTTAFDRDTQEKRGKGSIIHSS